MPLLKYKRRHENESSVSRTPANVTEKVAIIVYVDENLLCLFST